MPGEKVAEINDQLAREFPNPVRFELVLVGLEANSQFQGLENSLEWFAPHSLGQDERSVFPSSWYRRDRAGER
jgi:hypothetical protein